MTMRSKRVKKRKELSLMTDDFSCFFCSDVMSVCGE